MDGNESTVWGRKDLWESSKEGKIARTRVRTLRRVVPSFLRLLGLMNIPCLLETGAPFLSPPIFPCILVLKINMPALLILWFTIPVLYRNRTGLLSGPYPLVFHSLRIRNTDSSSCTVHGNIAGCFWTTWVHPIHPIFPNSPYRTSSPLPLKSISTESSLMMLRGDYLSILTALQAILHSFAIQGWN